MPHSTGSSFLHDQPLFPGHSFLDLNGDDLQETPRPWTPVDDLNDMLSPDEAEHAYSADLSRPRTLSDTFSRRNDSPQQRPDGRLKRQPVMPLDTPFSYQMPLNNAEPRHSFRGTQLESLEELVKPTIPILVQLRTNVIVKDEFKLVTRLSSLLTQLYVCSQESIMINLDHSVCLMLGSGFDPAYFMHISTTPRQMDLHANGVNTNEIQKFLHRMLKVPAHRGIIRFQPMSEDNVGTKGTTVTNLNAHISPERNRRIRPQSRGGDNTASFVSQSKNPTLPTTFFAHSILDEQIMTMSERGDSSIRSGMTSHSRRDTSPPQDEHRSSPARRRPASETPLDFHKPRPRPLSTQSFASLIKDQQDRDIKGRHRLSLPIDQAWLDSTTDTEKGLADSDQSSEDSGTAEPPPIAGFRDRGSDRSVKQGRRRSLFAVFRR